MAAQLEPELWAAIVRFVATPSPPDRSPEARRARARRRREFPLHDAFTAQSDIGSICLTSRQLNSIATPFLYAAPVTDKPLLFARTIMENPHLARLVKSLSHTWWNKWPFYVPSDIDPRFVDLVREHDALHIQHMREAWKAIKRTPFEGPSAMPEGEIPRTTELWETAVFAMLPRLCDVAIKNALMPVWRSLKRNSLPDLRTLKIQFDWEHAPELSPRALDWLTVVAPNIRCLTLVSIARQREGVRIPRREFWGDRADEESAEDQNQQDDDTPWTPSYNVPIQPRFSHVTHLCFRRCLLAEESLPSMLRAFPALETLHFDIEPRDGHTFSTAVLEAALLEHVPRLRGLRVDISRYHACLPYADRVAMTWSPALAEMENLRVLVTSVMCLAHGTGGMVAELGGGGLVGILPPNIEVLVMPDVNNPWTGHVSALKGLAEAIGEESFPALRKVVYGRKNIDEKGFPEAVVALEEQGVRVMLEDIAVACSEAGDNGNCLRHFQA